MTVKLKDESTPFKHLQREISDMFLSLLRDCAADVEFSLGKPPCRYSIFAGGSIARQFHYVPFLTPTEEKQLFILILNLEL